MCETGWLDVKLYEPTYRASLSSKLPTAHEVIPKLNLLGSFLKLPSLTSSKGTGICLDTAQM